MIKCNKYQTILRLKPTNYSWIFLLGEAKDHRNINNIDQVPGLFYV